MKCLRLLVLAVTLFACAKSYDHDGDLAGKDGEEFARVAFINRDFERGYTLLADSARRYIPVEKFKEVVTQLHPNSFPTKVRATEYEPMPGEKAVYVYLIGEGPGERFYYRLTMEGTIGTGYKTVRLYRGKVPYPPSSDRKKIGKASSKTS